MNINKFKELLTRLNIKSEQLEHIINKEPIKKKLIIDLLRQLIIKYHNISQNLEEDRISNIALESWYTDEASKITSKSINYHI